MATTTPNYGWDVPTSTDYVKDGATAIETLGDDIDATLYTALGGAYPGLKLVKKQAVGSGVSNVTVTGAFSATYENYLIQINNTTSSVANIPINLKLGSTTTGYYSSLMYSTWAGSPLNSGNANTAFFRYVGTTTSSAVLFSCQLNAPFLSTWTSFQSQFADSAAAGTVTGNLQNTTSYTAFTIEPQSGTLTGGNIYVYGYGIS
jgi:hypothetical protein